MSLRHVFLANFFMLKNKNKQKISLFFQFKSILSIVGAKKKNFKKFNFEFSLCRVFFEVN